MLDIINFKPTKKLCSYWSSLPQSSYSLGKTKIPALFSEHRSVAIENTLFLILILFETFTILYLEDQGVTFVIMAILAFVEIIIAILPLLWQNKQNYNKAYVETQIFVSAIKLKWSNPNDEVYNNRFNKDKKDWDNKLFKIKLISAIFSLIIIGFGFWKFWTYYELLGNMIFTQLIGRFILISIVLGIFVHLFATKTVFLNLLMKSRLKKELNQFYAGINTSCDTDDGYTMIEIPLNIFRQRPSFVKFSVKAITNSQNCRAQILERFNSAEDNNLITVRNIKSNGGGDPVSYTERDNFSDGATLLYTKLLRDKDIQDLMNVQESSNHYFEQEIIAAFAKEQQLNKYI